jgi:hypothetical protein
MEKELVLQQIDPIEALLDDVMKTAHSENYLKDKVEIEIVREELSESVEIMCNKMIHRNNSTKEEALRKIRAQNNFYQLVKEVKNYMELMPYFRVDIFPQSSGFIS